MLILRNGELIELLTVEHAIAALTAMLHEQAAGGIDMPARITVDADGGSWLRLMPSIHNQSKMMGFKSMNLTPGSGVRYMVALIDITDGALVALLDADYITTLRTSATAAIATQLLAPAEIEAMALLGTSTQADGLVDAMAAVRTIPRINVFSPNPVHRQRFAERVSARTGIEIRAVASAQEAVRSANLVCGAYRASKTPGIEAADLRTGTHVNSLSSVRLEAREVADDVWRACSRVVVDHRHGVAVSGDGASVVSGHVFDLDRAPELWEIVRDGSRRTADDGITMFKSVGAATQDIAVAMLAYQLARERGIGQDVPDFPALRVHQ
jgi:ornithine cyclodeaminase/alanine dehydrogenase-like protein (mu-crystallin family)